MMDKFEEKKEAIITKVKNFFASDNVQLSQSSVDSEIAKRISNFFQKIKAGQTNWIYWLGLIPVFIITWYVRTRNLPLLAGKYLVELDSYFFFRYAKIIYETGTLPVIDMMRYSPLGFPTSSFKFFPLTMAYFYKFIHFLFPNLSQIEWHIYYPPIITIVSFVFFFLFVKELFGHRTALISTAFLGVIPAYIQRTSAGFADHEAMAMLWMFASLWLFVLMWKSTKMSHAVIFGLSSGFFAGLMANTWNGHGFLKYAIVLFFLTATLFKHTNNKRLVGFVLWWVVDQALLEMRFGNFIRVASFLSPENLLFLSSLFAFIAGKHFVPILKAKNKLLEKLPEPFVALVLLIIPAAIFVYTTKIVDLSYSYLSSALGGAASSRFGTTVAESQIPSFFGGGGWMDQYGWLMWFTIFGGAILLYKIFEIKMDGRLLARLERNKYAIIAAATYFLFIFIFIKNRSEIFSRLYLPSIFITIIALCALYLLALRDREFFNSEKNGEMLAFVLLFFTLIITNIQIRLLFVFAPAAAIGSGVFVSAVLENLWRNKARAEQSSTGPRHFAAHWTKLLALLFCALVLFVFYASAVKAEASNRGVGPMVPGPWESAMTFLREQTQKDSAVAHWWDYGHMTAAIGERVSVTDGGNVRSWNHASGRYFLTGKDKQSTLEYLKSHNVTHILISDQEIPKYHAFSLIGSDKNFDRYSTIGVFALQDIKEARDGIIYLYGGGWPFDSNLILGNFVLPAGQASIVGFSLVKQNDTYVTPKAYVNYGGRQLQFDLTCFYKSGKRTDFPETQNSIKGCLVLIPYFTDPTKGNEDGAALWASEKVWYTNFARLYLYDEFDPNFKLVYKDSLPLAVYQGRTVGPIKIWEVNYPLGIQPSEKYLESSVYG